MNYRAFVACCALFVLATGCEGPNAPAAPDDIADGLNEFDGFDGSNASDGAAVDIESDGPDGPDGSLKTPLRADAGPKIYALVGEEVAFDGGASTGATTYRWSFGDGPVVGDPIASPLARHTYAAPGRYPAVLTAWSDEGLKRSDQVVVTVTWPATFVPRDATPMARLPDGAIAVAVQDDDALVVFNATPPQQEGAPPTMSIRARYAALGRPRTVTVGDSGVLLVACQSADRLRVIDVDLGELTSFAFAPGSLPYGAVEVPAGIAVTLAGPGAVVLLGWAGATPADGLVALKRWSDLPDVRGISALPDGRIMVTRWRSPDAGGVVTSIDPETGARATLALAVDPQGSSDTEIGGVPSYLNQVAISPTGREAVLPSLQANIAEGEFRDGTPLTFDTTLRAVVSWLELDLDVGLWSERFKSRKQFDNRGFASAALWSSRGDFLFIATRGSRTVERLDAFSGGQSGSILDVGYAPDALALSADDRFLFVHASLDRWVRVYDIRSFANQPQALATFSLIENEPLSPEVLRGKQLFSDAADPRLARDSYIACAHCHLEGLEDARVWDFTDRGEGLRNTISLAGRAGVGDGPVHWSANFDEIHDFEHDIRGPFGGTGLMADADFAASSPSLGPIKAGRSADLDALAAYVTSLNDHSPSPHRAAGGGLTAEAVAGRAIFEDPQVGCGTCHSGPRFTDSAWLSDGVPNLHDVGTMTEASGHRLGGPLPGLDTPTLQGVWRSAPYLHDGSAPTLEAVLTTRNPDDLHGVTSGLDASDRAALVAFLMSLDARPLGGSGP